MKILTIGASTSSTSINRQLAQYGASLVPNAEITSLDLNDFEMPLYSSDRENNDGVPQAAQNFVANIEAHDAIVLSLAEHNGSYTAAFKNVLDWASRAKPKPWSDKKMILLATSPGERGAATVLQSAAGYFPHMGATIAGTFSLPSFYDHFSDGTITDPALLATLQETMTALV